VISKYIYISLWPAKLRWPYIYFGDMLPMSVAHRTWRKAGTVACLQVNLRFASKLVAFKELIDIKHFHASFQNSVKTPVIVRPICHAYWATNC